MVSQREKRKVRGSQQYEGSEEEGRESACAGRSMELRGRLRLRGACPFLFSKDVTRI